MTLAQAWLEHKNMITSLMDERDELNEDVTRLNTTVNELETTNTELTNMNAALAQQLEESNNARTTPGGYLVDAAGEDGSVIDEIISQAQGE